MRRIEFDNKKETSNNKRIKSNNSINDFIVDDMSVEQEPVKLSIQDKKLLKKLDVINNEIDRRDITEEDILKMELDMDDNIWFIEHIRMLDILDDDTEEKYALKQKIYNRYKQVTSQSYSIMKKKYGISTDPDEDIIKRIIESSHNDHVKFMMYTRILRASEKGTSDEYFKAAEWVDTVLKLPTEVKLDLNNINITAKLTKFWETVNDRVFGLNPVKEKLLEALNTYLMSKGTVGRVITLIGPPGVGKTSMAEILAEAMELPFNQISMSDVTDPTVLIGHSSTYIGSHPGVIVEILKKTRRLDNLILLDEIDKMSSNSHDFHNISSVMLKILDKTQNRRFNDAYMPEIDIDLSKSIFIATANDEHNIPPALSDRLYKIYIDGYNIEDKVNIGCQHILPNILKKLGISNNQITIEKNVMRYLIDKLNQTAGVRNLERAIEEIIDKILLMSNINKNIVLSYKVNKLKLPLNITKEHVDKLIHIS